MIFSSFQLILDTVIASIQSESTELAQSAVTSAFNSFKTKLIKIFGNDSKPVKALNDLEENPTSISRKGVVQEEFEEANVLHHPELSEVIQQLIEAVKANEQTITNQINNTQSSVYGVQSAQNVDNINQNFYFSSEPEKKSQKT